MTACLLLGKHIKLCASRYKKVTSGAGTAYLSGAPEFTLAF